MNEDSSEIDERDESGAMAYLPIEQIDFSHLTKGLGTLSLFSGNVHLRMQAFNLQIVDEWTTNLEVKILKEWFETERTPPETYFLNAQSQMWIMAVYEVLRTWRQLARYVADHVKAGTLEGEVAKLRRDQGYFSPGREARVQLLEEALKDSDIVACLPRDGARLHIPFRRIEAIRMVLAKHEERGRRGSIAHEPGYGRINMWCGSLDYELSIGRNVLGTISRRDIADSIRSLARNDDPPDSATLAAFDTIMRGPSAEEEAAMTAAFDRAEPETG